MLQVNLPRSCKWYQCKSFELRESWHHGHPAAHSWRLQHSHSRAPESRLNRGVWMSSSLMFWKVETFINGRYTQSWLYIKDLDTLYREHNSLFWSASAPRKWKHPPRKSAEACISITNTSIMKCLFTPQLFETVKSPPITRLKRSAKSPTTGFANNAKFANTIRRLRRQEQSSAYPW